MSLTLKILHEVVAEKTRAEGLKAMGKFPCTPSDGLGHCRLEWSMPGLVDAGKLAILTEELGEVARHVNERLISEDRHAPKKLKEELIQLAAMAVAWAEAIERDDL